MKKLLFKLVVDLFTCLMVTVLTLLVGFVAAWSFPDAVKTINPIAFVLLSVITAGVLLQLLEKEL